MERAGDPQATFGDLWATFGDPWETLGDLWATFGHYRITQMKKKKMNVESEARRYFPMVSTMATQAVATLSEIPAENQPPLTITYGAQKIEISSVSDVAIPFGITAKKLFDYLLLLLTKYNSYMRDWTNGRMAFHLEDYINLMGVQNTRQNRHKYFDIIVEDFKKLEALRLKPEGASDWFGIVRRVRFLKRDRIEGTKKDVVNKQACFMVDVQDGLLEHFQGEKYLMSFLRDLFKRVGQSGNAYAMAKRMLLHYGSNRQNANRSRLRVSNLLDCCPAMSSPRTKDIKGRFEEALGVLAVQDSDDSKAMIDWCYIYDKKRYDAQEIRGLKLPHGTWLNLVVEFAPVDYRGAKGYADPSELDTDYKLLLQDAPEEDVPQTVKALPGNDAFEDAEGEDFEEHQHPEPTAAEATEALPPAPELDDYVDNGTSQVSSVDGEQVQPVEDDFAVIPGTQYPQRGCDFCQFHEGDSMCYGCPWQ